MGTTKLLVLYLHLYI